jgi:hypothetical protein
MLVCTFHNLLSRNHKERFLQGVQENTESRHIASIKPKPECVSYLFIYIHCKVNVDAGNGLVEDVALVTWISNWAEVPVSTVVWLFW